MGDLNAMAGTVNMGNERVMGTHGYGNLNDNGESLVDLCGMNTLIIESTLFPHKDIQDHLELLKQAWQVPNWLCPH